LAANWSARRRGFLLFYANDRNKLRHAMAAAGLEECVSLLTSRNESAVP